MNTVHKACNQISVVEQLVKCTCLKIAAIYLYMYMSHVYVGKIIAMKVDAN